MYCPVAEMRRFWDSIWYLEMDVVDEIKEDFVSRDGYV